jgi:uncharacterized protein YndB with AHSA1/START domain
MTATTREKTTTQVFRVFIRATPDAVWEAITSPDWTARYGYLTPAHYDLRPGGAYRAIATDEMRSHGMGEVAVEGEVLESDPPRRLVQTWKALFGPEFATEPATRLTWEIEPEGEVTRLTVIHDVTDAPSTAAVVSGDVAEAGGGWAWVLSSLKTLLETGRPLGR